MDEEQAEFRHRANAARQQTLAADLGLALIVSIVAICAVLIVAVIVEHEPTMTLPAVVCSFVLFLLLGTSEWAFSEFGGRLSDHHHMLSATAYWLLWELLVCAPSVWDYPLHGLSAALTNNQVNIKLLLYGFCQLASVQTITGTVLKCLLVLMLCFVPLLRNDGLSTDEVFQFFQYFAFLFNYVIDFGLSKLVRPVDTAGGTRLNSTLQALWCLVVASYLPLVAGTVLSLVLRTASLLISGALTAERSKLKPY